MITIDQLKHMMPHAGEAAETFLDPLNAAMEEFMLAATQRRQAMFLANVAVESGELRHLEENLNYSAKALRAVFGRHFKEGEDDGNGGKLPNEEEEFARQPERIANRVYSTRYGNGDECSGEGWLYRGRGLIQVTFKNNYFDCANALGLDLITHPELLTQPIPAARSAAWFFAKYGCNELADADNFIGVCGTINIGHIPKKGKENAIHGLKERREYYSRACEVLLP